MSTSAFRSSPPQVQAYVAVIVVLGFSTIVHSAVDLAVNPRGWTWTVLALLTLLSGSATVRLPSLPATISISETFVFTSVLLFGPAAGTLTVALDAFVISFWAHRRGNPLYKVAFNVCAVPLAIWVAAHMFFQLAGIPPLASTTQPVSIRDLIIPLVLFTTTYFLLNSWIIAFAIALEKRLPAFRIWRDNIVWLSLNYFGGASVAALLVSYTRDLDFTYLAIIVPLLVVIYFMFSMSLGRVADANRHLRELNALYMSTIETLAMAIDAKDQITHGHIRRVQSYAVSLAQAMGVSDEKLIRAVEAAALLHDMGKLAVPEYILNKPGPLTPAEFEKMKLHASVGADILSAIDFPYPVVPIVRHHHENWDGTGYPDRLAGAAIPIGARILSVVDCFDALTSDRPYRPRLSDRDALRVLEERRGTMYDPLVVDSFIRIHPHLVAPNEVQHSAAPLAAITTAFAPNQTGTVGLENINASAGEAVALFELSRSVSECLSINSIGAVLFRQVRRLIPHTAGVLFIYSEDTDELIVSFASSQASLLLGISLPLGQRLSGWVGANRQTIRNSDPVLDLGEAAKSIEPRLRSCLSTPLVTAGRLVGVLTLYSDQAQFFTEEHQRLLEAIAAQVSSATGRAATRDVQKATVDQRQASTDAHLPELISRGCLALIEVKQHSGREHLLTILSRQLGSSDLLFQHGPHHLAVLFSSRLADSVRDLLNRAMPTEHNATYSIVSVPEHGRTLHQLLGLAEQVLRQKNRNAGHSSVH